MGNQQERTERRIREVKVRLIALDWLDAGSVKSIREARRILDSLADSEIDFEHAGLPRTVRVQPILARYEETIRRERGRQ